MNLGKRKPILSVVDRSVQAVKLFTTTLQEFKDINADVALEKEQIKMEIQELQQKSTDLTTLETKNAQFIGKLENFLS